MTHPTLKTITAHTFNDSEGVTFAVAVRMSSGAGFVIKINHGATIEEVIRKLESTVTELKKQRIEKCK